MFWADTDTIEHFAVRHSGKHKHNKSACLQVTISYFVYEYMNNFINRFAFFFWPRNIFKTKEAQKLKKIIELKLLSTDYASYNNVGDYAVVSKVAYLTELYYNTSCSSNFSYIDKEYLSKSMV